MNLHKEAVPSSLPNSASSPPTPPRPDAIYQGIKTIESEYFLSRRKHKRITASYQIVPMPKGSICIQDTLAEWANGMMDCF
jgi:hypothetical protein